ncbi:hypothetical protein AB0436_15415 [Streptomyces sp. NPDC051322]|uniref:hypothetical protein n=1 Tax=Streptomyces sp. NPDC051322 TaxID=3154645 RepID=UPI00344EF91E
MSARRPLLTATAAGTLLCALWFVPSANATDTPRSDVPAHASQQHTSALGPNHTSVDSTHFLIGGSVFLGLGTASVAIARRRTCTTKLTPANPSPSGV